jgi:hypothetical protein
MSIHDTSTIIYYRWLGVGWWTIPIQCEQCTLLEVHCATEAKDPQMLHCFRVSFTQCWYNGTVEIGRVTHYEGRTPHHHYHRSAYHFMTQTRDHSALGPDSEGPSSAGKPRGGGRGVGVWGCGGVPSINTRKEKYISLNFVAAGSPSHIFVHIWLIRG